VASLPLGWHFGDLHVNGSGSELTLDHDRAGRGALTAGFKAGCDTTGATEVAAGNPGIRRLQTTASGTPGLAAGWYDVFPGGCVTVRLHSTTNRPEVNAALRGEGSRALGFTSRSVLRQLLLNRSDGRLHLDPGPQA
jgi:hypothetical protein